MMRLLDTVLLRRPFFHRFRVNWRWPEGVPEESWEKVTIPTTRGYALAGVWGEAYIPAIGVIVMAHPMLRIAKGFWLREGHAELLRRSGFHVVCFDANGFGDSPVSSPLYFPDDITCVGHWSRERGQGLPIGLFASSFGACCSFCAITREDNPFHVAVLESLTPTLPDFWRHYKTANIVLKILNVIYPKVSYCLDPDYQVIRSSSEVAILMVYGEKDAHIPPHLGQRLFHKIKDAMNVRFHVIENAEHTFCYRDNPQQYCDVVIPFLQQSLQVIPAGATVKN